jgi:hypothetical protein
MKKFAEASDTKIKLNGIAVLNKSLDRANALRFLSLLHWEPSDYVKISLRLYQGQTVDEVFKRAEKSWKKS